MNWNRASPRWRNCSAPDTALPAPDNGAGAGNGAMAAAMPWRISCGRRFCGAGGRNCESDAARGMPVAIRLKLSRAGVISDVQIVDQSRFVNDKLFRDMALSARNAALLASPISLPPGKYDAVMDIAITLDPKAVLH